MSGLVSLSSFDLIVVDGRPVFTFDGVPALDPRTLLHTTVLIDGHAYRVIGVETRGVVDVAGTHFGLMVERL